MAVYHVSADELIELEATNFAAQGILERQNLQKLLRNKIDVIAENVLIIAEEFCDWDDSSRRIDLLGIDKDANIIVVEIKRTDDGGHMDLQSIRYAAMASTMTFENAVRIYSKLSSVTSDNEESENKILEFLGWDAADENKFGQDVKIILVSGDFSKEITTSVLWLLSRGIDIRCVRLKPYIYNNNTLIDVQQIIPIKNAENYQLRIATKAQIERKTPTTIRDYTKFDVKLSESWYYRQNKRNAIFLICKYLCNQATPPADIARLITWRTNQIWTKLPGKLNATQFRDQATKTITGFDAARWFCSTDDEIIHYENNSFVFINQWGKRTEEAIKILTEKYSNIISYKISETGHEP